MILLKNGKIYDGKGDILEGADILIENGKIKNIAKSIEAKKDMEIFDVEEKVIMPGFIDSLNVWGCKGPGWEDDDLSEHSNPVTPQLDVMYSFDHDSMLFQRVFEYGVTSAGITPSTSNVLGGHAAVFKTYGQHPYEMLVKKQVGMVSSVTKTIKKVYGSRNESPMTKMGAIALLREALIKAQEYKDKDEKEYDPKSEALQKVIKRKLPLLINCSTKAEMDAVELALKDFPVDIVFTGAFGVHDNLGQIFKDNFSIILGDLTAAISYENSKVDFEAVKKMINKKVDVAISSCGDYTASGKESLLWNAILYYKYGLDENEVIKMITSIPAKILGVDDRVGSIEVGKDADIVIWSDNPIKTYNAQIEATFIDGKNILNSRRENTCWS
ncbi:MAG: amidohydrolase family protein [Halanaerobiales bacterium]|nr:amidohydrolase family protein [Halanaerobiales bacterium]